MAPFSVQPDRVHRAPRRTVRIIKPRRVSRAALLSFSFAVVAALSFPLIWKISHSEPPEESIPALPDREWKCDGGHIFHASIGVTPRDCPECNRPSFLAAWYTCSIHGSFEITARITETEGGEIRPSHFRLTGRKWVTESKLVCPQCDRPLVYKGRDPLERVRHGRRGAGS